MIPEWIKYKIRVKINATGEPRRSNIETMTCEEKAIQEAMWAIGKLGADTLLTEAEILLGQAKDKLSDFIDRDRT
jgi:hypothetical protein